MAECEVECEVSGGVQACAADGLQSALYPTSRLSVASSMSFQICLIRVHSNGKPSKQKLESCFTARSLTT